MIRRVAVHARLGQLGEEIAEEVEQLGIGGGVRARRAADRALAGVDDAVDVLEALDLLVRRRAAVGAPRAPSVFLKLEFSKAL